MYPPFEDKRPSPAYYVAPPIGLLSIASYPRQAEQVVEVHDLILRLKTKDIVANEYLYQQCAGRILATEPDVVALSTQCSTGPGAINIARHVKAARPDIYVVLGGHDVSFLAKEYLGAFPWVDAVLAGEGELTVPKLAAALEGKHPWDAVAGLTWRSAGGAFSTRGEERVMDLDTLLAPSYDLVDHMSVYFENSLRPTILIDSGRGCAFACEFCQTTQLSGKKVRYRSVPSLISELRLNRETYGEYEAYFVHDLFTARRKFVEELCEGLIAADLGVRWQCRCRIDQVDEQLLSLMSAAGCEMLLYGVESGSEATLKQMNKRLRPGVSGTTVDRAAWTVKSGIFPSLAMVTGIPEETLQDLESTLGLAAQLTALGKVHAFIQLMSPLPRTALAKRVESRLEYHGEEVPNAFSQGIEFLDGRKLPEDEQLILQHPDIFQSFYSVRPDHGDLELCVDVAAAYCKILEVYGHSFVGLTEQFGLGYLELFKAFRAYVFKNSPAGRASLVGLSYAEIWRSFESFTIELMHGLPECRLGEIFQFERLVHDIAGRKPVTFGQASTSDEHLRLHEAARIFTAEYGEPWGSVSESPVEKRRYLVYMTEHRLCVAKLTSEMLDAVEGVCGARRLDDPVVQAHRRTISQLARRGILQPITDCV